MSVGLPIFSELQYTHPIYKLSDFSETFTPYLENARAAWQLNGKNLDVSVVIHPHIEAGVVAVYNAIEARGLLIERAPASQDFLDGCAIHIQSSSPESAI